MNKPSLLLAAFVLLGCSGYEQVARGTDGTPPYWPVQRIENVTVVTKLSSKGDCYMDVYFADGSKYYAGSVDARICAQTSKRR